MQAFAHWTFRYTQRELLVCDIQGVLDGRRFRLTDPAINSRPGPGGAWAFGRTDRGEVGQNDFFKTHRCRALCGLLRIQPDA